MIRLRAAAAFLRSAGQPVSLAFGPVDLDIPTNRSIAVTGGTSEARTLFLRVLLGRTRPCAGAVIADASLSPIVNDEKLLHPALTGLANLRFLARAYGVDYDALVRAVDAFCHLGSFLPEPVRNLDAGVRRTLETYLAILLPFDCTLLDEAQRLPAPVLAECRSAARANGSGLIFATGAARIAREYAAVAIVIDEGCLVLTADPREFASRTEQQLA